MTKYYTEAERLELAGKRTMTQPERWQAISVKNRSAAEIAKAVTKLLQDDALAAGVGESGRAFVARRFDPQAGLLALEALLIGGGSGAIEAA